MFRIAFAGNRDLPTEAEALDQVLAVVAERLRAPSAVVPVGGQPVTTSVTAYYKNTKQTPPVLRLLTGLAEGADQEAAEALLRRQETEKNKPTPICVKLAAVLGCDVKTYHDSRVPAHQPLLDALLPKCRYVLALDGIYRKDPNDEKEGKHHRARLYRGQAAFLLRHADVVLAMADPQKAGSAGGTLETVRKALAFGLPLIFINTADASIAVIEPGRDDADGRITTNGTTARWRIATSPNACAPCSTCRALAAFGHATGAISIRKSGIVPERDRLGIYGHCAGGTARKCQSADCVAIVR